MSSSSSKKTSSASQNLMLRRLSSKVGRLEAESKSNVNSQYTTGAPTTGNTATLIPLTEIAEGDTYSSRTGRAIRVHRLRFSATATTASSTVRDTGRLIILRWKPALAGGLPTIGNILFNTTQVNSPFVPWNRKDYVVLYDKLFTVNALEPQIIEFDSKLDFTATYNDSSTSGRNENTLFALYLFAENTSPTTFAYYTQVMFSP